MPTARTSESHPVPSIYSSARPEPDRSPVCRHHARMISSFVRALISVFKARRKLTLENVALWRRCCTARSKSLTSLCRLQSHPAQYVSGIRAQPSC